MQVDQLVFKYPDEAVQNEVRLAIGVGPLNILVEGLERQVVAHDHVDVKDV